MVATPVRRTRRPKETTTPARDPRTIKGALVRVPNGDRAYVEGLDLKDSNRVLIQYEARFKYGKDPYDTYPVHLLTLVQESPEPPPVEETAIAPAPSSPLDTLAAEINELYGQLEEAEEVAISAAKSALTFAREMGEKLLQAKKECGHGNWENWRKKLVSPRSGKAMPSSTATLYQRIAKRWQEVEQAQTLREAAALLKGDRVSVTPVTSTETDSTDETHTKGSTGSTGSSGNSSGQSQSDAGRNSSAVESGQSQNPQPAMGTVAREQDRASHQLRPNPMESRGVTKTRCYNCHRRKLEGDGSTYSCKASQFEGDRLLKADWAIDNGGCIAFEEPLDFARIDIEQVVAAHGAKQIAIAALKLCTKDQKSEVFDWLVSVFEEVEK